MARVSRAVLRRNAKVLAQSSVKRNLTGNLQQNSIREREAARGVMVYVDDNSAPYGEMLNRGAVPGMGMDHLNWWDITAYYKIAVYVESNFNGKASALTSARKMVEENQQDTVARQMTYTRNIRRTSQ